MVAVSTQQQQEGEGKEEDNEEVQVLLNKHADLFTPLQGIPPEERVQHAIQLEPDARPVMKRPYRLSAAQVASAAKQLQQALEQGWIRPSNSPWGTAILMVPKKDGKWRLCVDYRDLNAMTIQDGYPLPRIDDLLHSLGQASVFSRLDLDSGYHQIWIAPEDREKTAFRIGHPVNGSCHFEWQVMPFGLKNAPATFQWYMTFVMEPCAAFTVVYMDDILVYSRDFKQHLCHLTQVFSTLQQAKLKAKRAKYEFGRTTISFLGHVIERGRIRMENTKQQALKLWEPPLKNAKQVRRFLRMASYYQAFLPRFSTIADPLIRLTHKRSQFQWSWEAQEAMLHLQHELSKAVECWVWQEGLATQVVTDASDVGMGAIIKQQYENQE